MARLIPFLRRSATGRMLAGVVALSLCAAAAPEPPPATTRIGRFVATKTAYPPDVLSRTRSVQGASLMTEPVLRQSNIREIQNFRVFLDKLARRTTDKGELVSTVNDYVNTHVKVTADDNLYNKTDVWAPPINTLILGGDCEDIALVKFWGLAYLGLARQDMFLVVGVSSAVDPPAGHAVLAVRLPSGGPDGSYVLLDSLERRVRSIDDANRFEPVYAVGVDGYWIVDDPTHDWGDFWRSTFKAAADRNGR
jgi:predicted transglutaminase-like cysteine proteinase